VKIPMALIADEANISQEGKLNVLGVFDRIAAPGFPIVHPRMVFVFRLEAEYGDGGKALPVRVRLIDEDGGVLFEAGGEIVAPEVPPGEFASAHQLFSLVGVRFERAGTYKFVVDLGGLPPHETPVSIVQGAWTPDGSSRAN
jgi:hypothetical protein